MGMLEWDFGDRKSFLTLGKRHWNLTTSSAEVEFCLWCYRTSLSSTSYIFPFTGKHSGRRANRTHPREHVHPSSRPRPLVRREKKRNCFPYHSGHRHEWSDVSHSRSDLRACMPHKRTAVDGEKFKYIRLFSFLETNHCWIVRKL